MGSQEISSNTTVISAPSQEISTGKTVNLSPSLRISNGMTNVSASSPMVEASGQRFRWPLDAKNLESAPISKSCLIPEVLQNLEELGILRSETQGWDNPAWKTDYARLIKPVSGPSL